jgi:hypothetical protein
MGRWGNGEMGIGDWGLGDWADGEMGKKTNNSSVTSVKNPLLISSFPFSSSL